MNIRKEKFTTYCEDNVQLKGLLLIPETPKAVLQFNGGTAAKKEFYLPFLEYLSEQNYLCCLWDYRGNGESAPENLATCDYYFREYGMQDIPAIKAFLQQQYPELPLLFFGHSAGGQMIGLVPDLSGVVGMVGFAVSTGYMWHMPLSYHLTSRFFFHLFSPISTLLSGYVKAKPFGIMENLPRNVVSEWRAWCRKQDYFFDPAFYGKTVPIGHYQNLPFPVHIYWTIDDPISNERSVPTFWSHIKSKKSIVFTKLLPSELGVKELGHFGFFKRQMKQQLWDRALSQLDSFLQHSEHPAYR